MTPEFSNSGRPDPSLILRNMQSAWKRIAHERVQERLDRLFFRVGMYGMSLGSRRDVYARYSEQEKRSRNSTSKVASRELEDAVFALENTIVQGAFEVYEDEGPEQPIKSRDLLWAIYNFGLVPYIQEKVLLDTCFRLARAQPSLGLDMSRPDADLFFSHNSTRLRKEFPVVIRIIEKLKSQWYEKIKQLADKTDAESPAVSTFELSDDRPKSGENAAGSPAQTIRQPPPDSQPSQSSLQPGAKSLAPIQSGSEMTETELQQQSAHELLQSAEQPASAADKQKDAARETKQTAKTIVRNAGTWSDIEIRFLSDDRLQIHIHKKPGETLNYAEFGFENATTGNPNVAWLALRQFAQLNGTVRNEAEARSEWPKFEKRVQEIRRVLREHFAMTSDPIPYVEGHGYKTLFKIGCAPSFHR